MLGAVPGAGLALQAGGAVEELPGERGGDVHVDVAPDAGGGLGATHVVTQLVTEGPCATFADCIFGSGCSRVSQIVSVAVIIAVVVTLILFGTGAISTSTAAYIIGGGIIEEGAKAICYAQRNINHSGFDAERRAFHLENETFKATNLQLQATEGALRADLAVSQATTLQLQNTEEQLRGDLAVVQEIKVQSEAQLKVQAEAIEQLQGRVHDFQVQSDRLRDENTRLESGIVKYEELLAQFEESLGKHTEELGEKVAALDGGLGRLDGIEQRFASAFDTSQRVIGDLKASLTAVVGSIGDKLSLQEINIRRQGELQAREIELAARRDAFGKAEDQLLLRMAEENRKQVALTAALEEVSENFRERRSRCAHICLRLLHLRELNEKLTARIAAMRDIDSSVVERGVAAADAAWQANIEAYRKEHAIVRARK